MNRLKLLWSVQNDNAKKTISKLVRAAAAALDGWPRILSRLKTLLETGKTFRPHLMASRKLLAEKDRHRSLWGIRPRIRQAVRYGKVSFAVAVQITHRNP